MAALRTHAHTYRAIAHAHFYHYDYIQQTQYNYRVYVYIAFVFIKLGPIKSMPWVTEHIKQKYSHFSNPKSLESLP